MSAAIRIEARALPQLRQTFRQLADRGADTSPLMDRIGMALESSTLQRFEDEEAPDGSPWDQSFRARVEGGKTLTKTARGRQSLTYQASRDQVELGTNVSYMAAHQGGATIRAKTAKGLRFKLPGGLGFRTVQQVILPKREFLGVSAEDEEEIVAQGEDYLAEVLP